MHLAPDFDAFAASYDAGKPQVVWSRLVADLETPVSAMLKLCGDMPNTFLLESVEGGAARGRYSIIGMAPDAIWRANGNTAEINTQVQRDPDAFKTLPRRNTEGSAQFPRCVAHRTARDAAAHGRWRIRLYGLRHCAPGRRPTGHDAPIPWARRTRC